MELKGIGVSAGIAVGDALMVVREVVSVVRLPVWAEAVEREVDRLSRAIEELRRQRHAIRVRVSPSRGPHAYIFDADLLMLDDPLRLERAGAVIRQDRVNGEW